MGSSYIILSQMRRRREELYGLGNLVPYNDNEEPKNILKEDSEQDESHKNSKHFLYWKNVEKQIKED